MQKRIFLNQTNQTKTYKNKGSVDMKKSMAIFWGIVLILVGTLLVLVQLNVIERINIFSWEYLWPAIMILLAIMFHFQFFAGGAKSPGILVPGGILLVYGCLFMYIAIVGWNSVGYLWPIFLVGPGFGLMELKLFSRGKEGSWIPVIILFGLAIFFFIRNSFSSFSMAVAVALIIVGACIIIASVFDRKKSRDKKSDVRIDVK